MRWPYRYYYERLPRPWFEYQRPPSPLPPRHEAIARRYLSCSLTLAQVGTEFGVSDSLVGQVVDRYRRRQLQLTLSSLEILASIDSLRPGALARLEASVETL